MSSRRARLGILGVVLLISAYLASIALYAGFGVGRPNVVVGGPAMVDGTKVRIDVQEVQSVNSLLIANVTVYPSAELLDPETHNLKDDLSVVITSTVTANKHTWPKGTLPDVFRVSLALSGEVAKWPFDHYQTGPLVAQLVSGPELTRVPAMVSLVDRLLGWELEAGRVHEGDQVGPYTIDVYRSPSTISFAVLILGVLTALACIALFVAVQTARDKRKFQPPMTTWYAAMLFAVVPLRNALPDAPPFGSWIDVTVVMWVIVVMVLSMVIYISCWWRHLRPEPEKPPTPADTVAPAGTVTAAVPVTPGGLTVPVSLSGLAIPPRPAAPAGPVRVARPAAPAGPAGPAGPATADTPPTVQVSLAGVVTPAGPVNPNSPAAADGPATVQVRLAGLVTPADPATPDDGATPDGAAADPATPDDPPVK